MGKKSKKKELATISRKESHVELVTKENVAFRQTSNGFDNLRFVHNALPEIALSDIDISTQFFGKHLDAPFLISSMTGGYPNATEINRELALLAKEYHIAIGVGSARQAMEDKSQHASYKIVRKTHPDGLVFTNVGAIEIARLTEERKIKKLQTIIDLVSADGLIIHLNPLQELMQPEGSTDFRGVFVGIETAVKELSLPIIVKEVGAGISADVAKRLLNAGVRAIDVAGAGGTSWAGVEILRHKKKERDALEPFWDWGIPTADALAEMSKLKDTATFGLIASGGIRNGVDAAKSLALRADLVGIARPFLLALTEGGSERLRETLQVILRQLRYSMFLTGSRDLAALSRQPLEKLN
jgi:isopentenyl-diphosphate Delta-isomerase